MQNPIVTIIIPVYNSENYITRCISSIQNQTRKDFEAILIDDYSQDQSAKVIEKIIHSDNRIKLIKNGTDSDLTNDVTDIITFNYMRTDVFISRACGYKTIFELDALSPFLLVNSSWIDHLEIEKFSVVNENETHVKIYF